MSMDDSKAVGESIARKAILAIAAVAVISVIASIAMMSGILRSVYTGGYYTASVLLDAVGYYPEVNVAFLSSEFYQFFTVLVLDGIARIIIVGFLIASIIELASRINIQSRLSALTARKLKDHVIVCGYSSFGEKLSKDLYDKRSRFVIIERERPKVDMLRDIGYLAIEGDFTKELSLEAASVRRARAAVLDSESDFESALATIAMKRLNPSIKVIARVNKEPSLTNMMNAGADQCIIPEILAGVDLGYHISRLV